MGGTGVNFASFNLPLGYLNGEYKLKCLNSLDFLGIRACTNGCNNLRIPIEA